MNTATDITPRRIKSTEGMAPPADTPIAARAARDLIRRAKTRAGTVAIGRALGLHVSVRPLNIAILGMFVRDIIVIDAELSPADIERVCGHELGHYWLQRHPSVRVESGRIETTCTAIGDALVRLCAMGEACAPLSETTLAKRAVRADRMAREVFAIVGIEFDATEAGAA